MWKIGTTRMLGIYDGNFNDEAEQGEEQPELLPPGLTQLLELHKATDDFTWGRISLVGDFEVCPLTAERAGWMQMVCIKAAKNVVLRQYR
jgi:hypothetical protein